MKTRLNKKSQTVNITLNHDEATTMWLALDKYSDYLIRQGCIYYANEVQNMWTAILDKCTQLN